MRRIGSILMLIVINGLLNTWTAVAETTNPDLSLERALQFASVASDRATDGSTYLLTMTLPEQMGKSFAKLSLSFTQPNQDKTIAPIPFDLPSTTAFVGAPNEGGRAIGVQEAWIDETGVLWVQFNAPVPPQTKLTLALKLRSLPSTAMYDYSIAAYPTNAAAIFVGDGTLTIKQ